MLDTDAEPEGAHPLWVEDPFADRFEDAARSDMVASQDTLELGGDVSAALETNTPQVRTVCDTQVVEWTQKAFVQCLPQTHVRRDALVKPSVDGFPVGALRSSRKPNEHRRR